MEDDFIKHLSGQYASFFFENVDTSIDYLESVVIRFELEKGEYV